MSNSDPTKRLTQDLARDLDRHFDDLVVTFQQPLFAYAYRTSGCRQDAEEVTQDVFIRAYRALREYEPERIRSLAVRAWLFQICINQIRNKHRRARVSTTELPDDLGQTDGPSDPVAHSYQRSEDGKAMAELVNRLPAKYRTPVILRFVNDLSYPEISEALGQPEGTVKSSVHRGLKLLRSYIEPSGERAMSLSATSTPHPSFPSGEPA